MPRQNPFILTLPTIKEVKEEPDLQKPLPGTPSSDYSSADEYDLNQIIDYYIRTRKKPGGASSHV